MKLLFVALLLLPIATWAATWQPNVTASANWDNNVTNADRATDRLGALDLRSQVAATRRITVSRDDSVSTSVRAAGDWWPAYASLSVLSGGVAAEWQHKFGLGPFAPVVSGLLALDALAARNPELSGGNYAAAVSVRKRLGLSTRLGLTETLSRRDERNAVYDRDAAETSLAVVQTVGENWELGATGFWRHGDIVSYATPPRPDLIALAPHRQLDDTFGAPRIAYSIRTDTVGIRFEAARALGRTTSASIAYEYRDTARSTLHYVNQLVSATLALQF